MASGSTKRIARELAECDSNPEPGIHISLAKENDIHLWDIVIDGPQDTPYVGGKFKLTMELPKDYPFKAPVINFKTRIYHPNVTDDDKGSICIGVLKSDQWKPSSKIIQILLAIRHLMAEPNPDDPLENSIAEKYKMDRPAFNKEAAAYTSKYAK